MMGKRKAPQQEVESDGQEPEKQVAEVGDEFEDGDEEEDGSSDLDSGSGSGDGSSSEPDVSDEGDESEDDEDGEAFEEVQVDFQFYDPRERDFHGLKALLHTYLDGSPYDSSALVDAIIGQASQVGTVVKTGEDDDPIGIMTVLNTQRYATAPFLPQIRDYITSKCSDNAVKQKLLQAWSSPDTGLLLNERLMNSPPQIAPPLVQALFEEVEEAAADTQDKESKWYRFKQYILLTRVYSDPAAQPAEGGDDAAAAGPSSSSRPPPGPSSKPKKQKAGSSKQAAASATPQAAGPLVVYVRPEDEFFAAQATACATFPVEGRPVGRDELQPLRCVMLLDAKRVPAARASLDGVIGNSYSSWQPDSGS